VDFPAINLRIASGSYCCLLGPSGCGKSTTLRMIAGHESVTSGDILLENRNITDLPAAARGTAMMFQSFALFPHLSALDNVAFSLKMKGVGKAERHMKAATCWSWWPWATWPQRKPGRTVGRPAAARGAGAGPDHPAARAAARRAAVGARPLPAHPDARRAASAGKRSWASPSSTSPIRRKRPWPWPTPWW
jgi:ABC-type dipeptide/oligopeptide/nickel transport system ATPase component